MTKKEVSKQALLKVAFSATKAAAKLLLSKQKSAKIKVMKNKWDYALNVDIQSEKLIKKIIKKKFPNHSFLAEESEFEKHKSDYIWVIDPLDGTLNYAHNIPMFGLSIAVLYKNKPVIGVIYLPKLNEFFHTIKGKGAFLNGKRIHVNKNKGKNNIFICGNPENWKRIGKKIRYEITRYFGCSGVELAYVACGRLTARVKTKGKFDPFGNIAGFLLIEEAGGKVIEYGSKKWSCENYIASNKAAHNELCRMFKVRKV